MEEVFRQRRFTTEKYDSQYVVSVDALQLREALPMVLFLGRHEGLEVPHVVDVSRDDLLCPVANFAQLNVKLCLGHPQLYLCLYVHIIATTITTIGISYTPIVIDDHM